MNEYSSLHSLKPTQAGIRNLFSDLSQQQLCVHLHALLHLWDRLLRVFAQVPANPSDYQLLADLVVLAKHPAPLNYLRNDRSQKQCIFFNKNSFQKEHEISLINLIQ